MLAYELVENALFVTNISRSPTCKAVLSLAKPQFLFVTSCLTVTTISLGLVV